MFNHPLNVTILFFGFIFINLNSQPEIGTSTTTSVSSSTVNTNSNKNGSASSTSQDGCSSASASVSASGAIKLSANSNQCFLGNTAEARGRWTCKDPYLTGTNGIKVPLQISFSLDGSIDIETEASNNWSAASASLSYDIWISPGSKTKGKQYMGHQGGAEVTNTMYNDGFDASDGYVVFKPYVKAENTFFDITDKMSKVLEEYEKLTDKEKDDNELGLTDKLKGGLDKIQDLQKWQTNAPEIFLDSNIVRLLNNLEYLGILKELGIGENLPVSFGADIEYHYDARKDISLETSGEIYIMETIFRVTASSTKELLEKSKASANFGNTFKISKVEIDPTFHHDSIDPSALRLVLGDSISIPVTWENRLEKPEISIKKEINLYPNPVNQFLQIRVGNLDGAQISVFSNSGREIHRIDAVEKNHKYSINTEQWSQGVYYLTTFTNTHQYTKQIIVTH